MSKPKTPVFIQLETKSENGTMKDPDGPNVGMLDNSVKEDPGFLRKYGGMMMAFLASVFFSTSFFIINVLVKESEKPALACSVLFNLGIFLPCVVWMIIHNKGPGSEKRVSVLEGLWPLDSPTKKKSLIILLFVGCLQGLSVLARSFALMYIPFGDMAVIVFSSPVVTTILAHFIVGEPLSCIFILIAIYTLFGVGLITKPPFLTGEEGYSTDTIIGSGLAVVALFSLSLLFATIRKVNQIHFLVKTAFLGGCGFIMSLIMFFVNEEPISIIPKTLPDYLLVFGLFSAFCAISANNIALQLENAGLVALVRSFDVIFAFLMQFVFLGVQPDMYSSIGGAIVVSAVVLSGVQKWWQERSANRRL